MTRKNWNGRGGYAALAGAALTLAAGLPNQAAAQSGQMLQGKIEQMERELQAMKAQMQEMQKERERTIPESHAAQETRPKDMAHSGNDNISLKIYGQVNREVMYGDDGNTSDVLFTDNNVSSSRFGFEGKGKVSSTFGVGAKIEAEVESNASDKIMLDRTETFAGDVNVAIRKVEFWIEDSNLGRLTLGQGSVATDDVALVDLSGTELAVFNEQEDFGGAFAFRNSVTGAGGPNVKTVFTDLDGSRDDRIRYDTPKIGGFVGSVALQSNDRPTFALTWGGAFPDFKAAAAIGYAHNPSSATGTGVRGVDDVVGSVSFLHSSGLNATFGAGVRDKGVTGLNDFTYWYGKLGYLFQGFSFGRTAIAIDYTSSSDAAVNGDDGEGFGLGIVQKVDAAALELYASVHFMSYDQPAANFRDITVATTGGRVKF